MKLISGQCEICGTKLALHVRACEDCERARRHASLLALYSRFDDTQAASRRAEWMATAISRVAARASHDFDLADAIEASLRTKLGAVA